MIGKRCQLSQTARQRGMKMSRFKAGRLLKYVGKIVGEAEGGTCWLVVWDGLKNSRPLEKVLIEAEEAA